MRTTGLSHLRAHRPAMTLVCAVISFFMPSLCHAQDNQQAVSYYIGATPLAEETVQIHTIKFHQALDNYKWISGVTATAGLYSNSENRGSGTYYSVGPYWQFWRSDFGVFEFEFAPTYVDREFIAGDLIGGRWHFTSALAFSHQFDNTPWSLGIRFQHTSNGGIENPNPGIDGIGLFIHYIWR